MAASDMFMAWIQGRNRLEGCGIIRQKEQCREVGPGVRRIPRVMKYISLLNADWAYIFHIRLFT